jgi:hypothetical protein
MTGVTPVAEYEVIKRVGFHEPGDIVQVPDGHAVDPYHYRPKHAKPEPEPTPEGSNE